MLTGVVDDYHFLQIFTKRLLNNLKDIALRKIKYSNIAKIEIAN